jgi:2',3'-cyclic-nucleotide 2'-phosphodiesterase (5'-nucleotidase family)
MTPFGNFLMRGELTGAQVMQILEGEAVMFHNQVSGLTYRIDLGRPEGMRVFEAKIGGAPISLNRVYTLTHNSFCASPERMEEYLHLKPGAIKWKSTNLVDYEILTDYARQLRVVDYPSEGEGRIVIER